MDNAEQQKNRAKAEEKAFKIKLLILDVDGVLTDGKLYFSANGETLKVFNSLDGHGIKMLRATGVEVAIISGRESEALDQRVANLGIQYYFPGREDKINALDELLVSLQLRDEQIAHLGDDLPDLPVIQRVGLGMAVANAYSFVKLHADWCARNNGGDGAVREACDFIMDAQGTLQSALDQYLHVRK
jgi:3-deoxy-D-manno-octulosonate 8-phosphate phosphatase (KDO 8-P phosphatase)